MKRTKRNKRIVAYRNLIKRDSLSFSISGPVNDLQELMFLEGFKAGTINKNKKLGISEPVKNIRYRGYYEWNKSKVNYK